METVKPSYGNWVSDKRISQTLVMSALFAAASAAAFSFAAGRGAALWIAGAVLALTAALVLVAALYFVRAKKLFSYTGGNVQGKILELVLNSTEWDGQGKALDIGCGSGALAIALAKRFPEASVTGVDYWGGSWSYAKGQCERNASLEGVSERTEFLKASASRLPFKDGAFGLVVSNLVFHEVKDVSDKRECIKEALRVLKKGGSFVFQDLFKLEPYYGAPDKLLELIKSWGVEDVHFENTSNAPFIPRALKLPFMVGALGMIRGIK